MNIELLRKVSDFIQENPKKLMMRDWTNYQTDNLICCIGGWAVWLAKPEVRTKFNRTSCSTKDLVNLAEEVLGLDYPGANKLFFVPYWPKHLWQEYEKKETREERAEATGRRIDLFIASGGKE
jgi:hypothetical protein